MVAKGSSVEITTKVSNNVTAGPPKLGAFTDYRQYLKEFYEFKREQTKGSLRPYNYGTFAASADIKSPNYLKLIIDGQRNLSSEMARKFAKALALGREETEE